MSGFLLIAVIIATAAITYAVVAGGKAAPEAMETTGPEPQQYSAAEQAAAKQRICKVFNVSLRGQQGEGGLRLDGELNIPVMLRRVNSVVAVQNALTAATPSDVSEAATEYIDTSLEMTTAATGNVPVDEGNRLNDGANSAIFADVCGLPR